MLKTMESSTQRAEKTTRARGASTRGAFCARRRGQTLLIAVLLMIAAALLGVTFITVVALNLSQTTRGTNTSEAQAAATAGVRYVNDRIVNSIEGEKWNPLVDRIPEVDPSDAAYDAATFDNYYSAFEQAQGWTNYVKYPDPLAAPSSRNSPTYLAKVTRETIGDRTGQLLVDIIGRSADNDAVFARRLAYKPTRENGGPGAFARYDSNYDFGGGRVIQTKVTAFDSAMTPPTITVSDASGIVPGRLLLIGSGASPASAIVRAVNGNVVSLNQIPAGVANGDTVRAASPLAGQLRQDQFDATGDGITGATYENTTSPVVGGADKVTGSTTSIPDSLGSTLINGGLYLVSKVRLALNRDATNPAQNDEVRVAGVIARDSSSLATDIEVTDRDGLNGVALPASNETRASGTRQEQVRDNYASEQGDPTADVIRPLTPGRIDAADSRYLKLTRGSGATGAEYGYGPGVYIDNREDVEKVGRLIGGTIQDFRPLTVSETQRLLQRKSFPVKAGEAANAYVDLSIPGPLPTPYPYAATPIPGSPNPVAVHRLSWPRPGFDTYSNTPTPPPTPGPATPTPIPVSLEERAIRGWVSPWEYKPRGVFIELRGNDIIITRDDRSDAVYSNGLNEYASVPNPNKEWRDSNGISFSGDPLIPSKIYRMRMSIVRVPTTDPNYDPNAPFRATRYFGAPTTGTEPFFSAAQNFNGVIYAEGNMRVRGFLNADAPDLTIVSMNNIYVEGNIRRLAVAGFDEGHVALLAKNNVVLNPTRFISPLEGSSDRDAAAVNITLRALATAGATSLNVDQITPLRVGDLVRVGVGRPLLSVVSITPAPIAGFPNAGIITLNQGLAADANAGASVRVLADPQVETVVGYRGANPLASSYAFATNDITAGSGPDGALMRDVRLDGFAVPGAATYEISMRHIGRKTPAFTLTAGAANTNAAVQIKADADTSGDIQSIEKQMQVTSPSGPSIYNLLQIGSNPATSDPLNRGNDAIQTLTELGSRFNADHPPAGPPPLPYWTLGVTAGGTRARQLPIVDELLTASQTIDVPLTVSSRLFWIPGLTTTGPSTADLDLSAFGFGSSFDWRTSAANPYPPTDVPATRESTALPPGALNWQFYQTQITTTPVAPQQAPMRWYSYTAAQPFADSRNVFGVLSDSGAGLASHLVGGVKIERSDNNGFAGASTNYTPGMNIEVDAQIYAQNGSWFVIPMPTLQEAPTLELAAIDADTTLTPAQKTAQKEAVNAASTRFRRQNYAITVNGTISQNFAPPLVDYDNEVDPDGVATGPQQRWIDSLAYPTQVNAAPLGGKYGAMWTTIQYIGQKLPPGNNLKMPISPDLLYVN